MVTRKAKHKPLYKAYLKILIKRKGGTSFIFTHYTQRSQALCSCKWNNLHENATKINITISSPIVLIHLSIVISLKVLTAVICIYGSQFERNPLFWPSCFSSALNSSFSFISFPILLALIIQNYSFQWPMMLSKTTSECINIFIVCILWFFTSRTWFIHSLVLSVNSH